MTDRCNQFPGFIEVLNKFYYILIVAQVIRVPRPAGYKHRIVITYFQLVCCAVKFYPAYGCRYCMAIICVFAISGYIRPNLSGARLYFGATIFTCAPNCLKYHTGPVSSISSNPSAASTAIFLPFSLAESLTGVKKKPLMLH